MKKVIIKEIKDLYLERKIALRGQDLYFNKMLKHRGKDEWQYYLEKYRFYLKLEHEIQVKIQLALVLGVL